jgi:hypothetical protein
VASNDATETGGYVLPRLRLRQDTVWGFSSIVAPDELMPIYVATAQRARLPSDGPGDNRPGPETGSAMTMSEVKTRKLRATANAGGGESYSIDF